MAYVINSVFKKQNSESYFNNDCFVDQAIFETCLGEYLGSIRDFYKPVSAKAFDSYNWLHLNGHLIYPVNEVWMNSSKGWLFLQGNQLFLWKGTVAKSLYIAQFGFWNIPTVADSDFSGLSIQAIYSILVPNLDTLSISVDSKPIKTVGGIRIILGGYKDNLSQIGTVYGVRNPSISQFSCQRKIVPEFFTNNVSIFDCQAGFDISRRVGFLLTKTPLGVNREISLKGMPTFTTMYQNRQGYIKLTGLSESTYNVNELDCRLPGDVYWPEQRGPGRGMEADYKACFVTLAQPGTYFLMGKSGATIWNESIIQVLPVAQQQNPGVITYVNQGRGAFRYARNVFSLNGWSEPIEKISLGTVECLPHAMTYYPFAGSGMGRNVDYLSPVKFTYRSSQEFECYFVNLPPEVSGIFNVVAHTKTRAFPTAFSVDLKIEPNVYGFVYNTIGENSCTNLCRYSGGVRTFDSAAEEEISCAKLSDFKTGGSNASKSGCYIIKTGLSPVVTTDFKRTYYSGNLSDPGMLNNNMVCFCNGSTWDMFGRTQAIFLNGTFHSGTAAVLPE